MSKRKRIYVHFADQLAMKARRDGRHISLRRAAVEMGTVSVSTLSRITRGYPCSLDVIGDMCSYLNCQPGDLLKLK